MILWDLVIPPPDPLVLVDSVVIEGDHELAQAHELDRVEGSAGSSTLSVFLARCAPEPPNYQPIPRP